MPNLFLTILHASFSESVLFILSPLRATLFTFVRSKGVFTSFYCYDLTVQDCEFTFFNIFWVPHPQHKHTAKMAPLLDHFLVCWYAYCIGYINTWYRSGIRGSFHSKRLIWVIAVSFCYVDSSRSKEPKYEVVPSGIGKQEFVYIFLHKSSIFDGG